MDTDTVPRGCRGAVVDPLVPDGCCVEFFDEENNAIDVLPLSQRDLAMVQLIGRDAVRAELDRLEGDALECKHRPDGRPDTARSTRDLGARRSADRDDTRPQHLL